jgi:DNA-binding response OmpR family regulator
MKHVLLLEDDACVTSILVRLLDEEKYYVSTTTRVGNAREFLERVKVDLDSTQTSTQTSIRSGRSAARACIRSLEEHAQTDEHSIRLFAPNFCVQ